MSLADAERVADAVLYEGYLLYPYRASSVKNRRRFTFGGVYPEAHCAANEGTSDAPFMQTECLVCGGDDAALDVRVRFLHLVEDAPAGAAPWQEAEPREVVVEGARLGDLLAGPRTAAFAFPALSEGRVGHDGGRPHTPGHARRREAIEGRVRVSAVRAGAGAARLSVRIENLTEADSRAAALRDEALLRTFVSTHTLLHVRGGELVSLTDPPEALRACASECRCVGAWPVLVGEEGRHDAMLSSPVILPDYPRIAPESPGDLFDATEIDEILTLRILTLTDEEKRDVRALDARARALLDRTEALGPDALLRLHGAMRREEGSRVRPGDRVRLAPRGRADVMDMVLTGMTATVAAVEQDLEGRAHLAVVVDDDPGRDLGLLGQPGHRFWFRPDEVEPAPFAAEAAHATGDRAGPPKILVAGVGNIFLGDDGFGCELASRLARRSWPEGVRIADYGIRGIDLAYALADGCDAAILLDTVSRGGRPGTLYVLEPEEAAGARPGHDGGYPHTPGHDGGYPHTPGHDGGYPHTPGHDGGYPHTPGGLAVDAHDVHPARALDLARAMGATLGRVRVVGCEPAAFGGPEEAAGLSAPVEAALDPAAELVAELVGSLVSDLLRACAHA